MQNVLFNVFPNESFIDLGLYQYGWEACIPGHSFGPSMRNHYLFHYIIEGSGTLTTMDSKGISISYHLKKNQGFLICPKQITSYMADMDTPWEYAWVEFDGGRVKEALDLAGLSIDSPIFNSISSEGSINLKETILYLANNPKETPLNLIGHLYLFLDYLTKISASRKQLKTGSMKDFYIKEAITFIEQNYQNEITIENMAEFCNLNRSYFGKIFKETVGQSPQDFLINYRMNKATQLLKLSELSIHDIGIAVGCPNQLHFSRAFKGVFNVSPRKWRSNNKRF